MTPINPVNSVLWYADVESFGSISSSERSGVAEDFNSSRFQQVRSAMHRDNHVMSYRFEEEIHDDMQVFTKRKAISTEPES